MGQTSGGRATLKKLFEVTPNLYLTWKTPVCLPCKMIVFSDYTSLQQPPTDVLTRKDGCGGTVAWCNDLNIGTGGGGKWHVHDKPYT